MMACEKNDIDSLKSLIGTSKIDHKNEVKKMQRGETCLSIAVKLGYEEIVKELISHKANVNCQNKAGQSAIYLASWHNQIQILRLLIQAGGDVNLYDNRR